MTFFTEPVVEPHVDSVFELPAVAYPVVGQGVAPFESRERRKHVAGSYPHDDAVAPPDVLPQFQLGFEEVLVAVTSFVVSPHTGRSAQRGEHIPRYVAIVELAVQVEGKNRPFPQPVIVVEEERGAGKTLFVAEECGEETLIDIHIDPSGGIGNKVAAVVGEGESQAGAGYLVRFAVEQFGFGKVGTFHPVESGGETSVKVFEQAGLPVDEQDSFESVVGTLVGVVVPVVVAYSPEIAGESIEVEIVVDAVFVLGEDIVALDADEQKSGCRGIAVERYVGELCDGVAPHAVGARSRDAQAQLGCRRVVGAADNAEIEFLVGARFVRVIEIFQDFLEEVQLFRGLGGYAVGRSDETGRVVPGCLLSLDGTL